MNVIIEQIRLTGELYNKKKYYNGQAFSGLAVSESSILLYTDGYPNELVKHFENGNIKSIFTTSDEYTYNGFHLVFEVYDLASIGMLKAFQFWDCGLIIESLQINNKSELSNYYNIQENKDKKDYWIELQTYSMKYPDLKKELQHLLNYNQQTELKEKVIIQDELPNEIKYIAGVDVAYNELEQRLVAGIVILDAQTFQIIEEASHEEKLSFPHVPGLLPFIEVPHVIAAFKKLSIKPDLIVCDGYGINHPKGVGIATHLGIELDIPTIACARKRLVGYYDTPEPTRSSNTSLQFANKEAGKVLRTQDNIEPVFVSVGHKISIETACDWILKLTQNNRLPQTTLAANTLTSKFVKERTDWDTPLDFYLKKMKEQTDAI